MAGPSLQHVTIHGAPVAYRRSGSGPVLLLIHGIAGSSRTWAGVLPLLARDFDVVAPDLLGHGDSAKPLGDCSLGAYASGLRDFMAVLGMDRATLVGHSLGGGIALQLAYQHPECCERLVLVDSGGLGREVSWLLRSLTLPGAELLAPVLFPQVIRQWGDGVARFLRDRGLRSGRAAESWRAYASLTDPDSRRVFLRTVRAVIDPGGQSVSALDRLYLAAHFPTLIVWGECDGIIPVDHGRAAHQAMPSSRLEIIEGAGHHPHVEEPLRFADAVADFVHATTPATTSGRDLAAMLQAGSRNN
ncbi:MAG: alpha/beta fold hydrolase [Actinomycetota bacterium]|nr:alpha/beta fold hydrolase [Actinomycetota bacterium]